jgi:hypothetical protein
MDAERNGNSSISSSLILWILCTPNMRLFATAFDHCEHSTFLKQTAEETRKHVMKVTTLLHCWLAHLGTFSAQTDLDFDEVFFHRQFGTSTFFIG